MYYVVWCVTVFHGIVLHCVSVFMYVCSTYNQCARMNGMGWDWMERDRTGWNGVQLD